MRYFLLQGSPEDTYFSFLPLAHIMDQILVTYWIYSGSSIGFWQGVKFYMMFQLALLHFMYLCRIILLTSHYDLQDIRYLIPDLIELKPTVFCGVPRVYDRIYTGTKYSKHCYMYVVEHSEHVFKYFFQFSRCIGQNWTRRYTEENALSVRL